METILNQQHPVNESLFASKSSITLDGTIGQYHKRSDSGEEDFLATSVSNSDPSRFEEPGKSQLCSSQGVRKPLATATHVQSRWNQFLPAVVDED